MLFRCSPVGDPLGVAERPLVVREPVEDALLDDGDDHLHVIGRPDGRTERTLLVLDRADDQDVARSCHTLPATRPGDRETAAGPGLDARRGYMIARMASVVDDLERVRLFSGLSRRQLRKLAQQVKEREFRPGVAVVKEGTMSGVGFFIVAEGEAAVSVDGQEVARLGPGDHFGELALISEDVRAATVTAATRLRCLVIAFWDFRRFARENPDVSWKLLQHVVGMLTDQRDRRARAALFTS